MQQVTEGGAEGRLARLVAALGIDDELFWVPDPLPTGERWAAHIPFAWWLVGALRPAQVVVLGAAASAATGALCQAIALRRLPARVFAIDPAGGKVADRYAHFAGVLRSGAASAFAPGSIDLLHVAGGAMDATLFAGWEPALSQRSVVLCDGIGRRDAGEDGWRCWQDLTRRFATFEFIHADGLGVLGVGAAQTPALTALLAAAGRGDDTELIRRLFALRGEALALRCEVDALRGEHARQATLLAEREAALRAREASLALLNLSSSQRLEERDAEIERLRAAITQFQESTSWRITQPLRTSMAFVQRLRARRRARPRTRLPEAVSVAATDGKTALRASLAARLRWFLADGRMLALPTRLPADVSIILVLHNQAEFTFGCLRSLCEGIGDDVCAEVIMFDNASSDATPTLLQRVSGATVIASTENVHFLLGVNRAARVAGGRHLLLLNNDAQVLPGALAAALRTLDDAADIGAVGGRIILPDGTLQEAGSIIWRDGSCSGYGRGRDPTWPEAAFRRDVDYCSGAFLLTPRAVFERLGGFDERYVPAYYEETDYCVRLWQHGLRVVYEPETLVLHYEFGSADGSAAALAQQQRNHTTFVARHRDWLAAQWPNRPENVLAARRHASARKQVLVIEDRVPHVRLGAGYPRTRDLLCELAKQADVTLFPAFKQPETLAGVRATLPAEIEVMLDSALPDLPAFMQERLGFYDAIIVGRPNNMRPFIALGGSTPALRGEARLIYDTEAIVANREAQRRALDGTPLSPAAMAQALAEELALARQADAVIAVSPAEQRQLRDNGIATVHLLGHSLELAPTATPFAERSAILFVGALHANDTPNTDSLCWFAEAVLPLLRRALGAAVRVTVVGINRVPAIAALDGVAFDLVGAVDDLAPQFARARIFIAPTRFAAGLPHKIAQAAAHGVPVVATDLLAGQLGWQPGRDLLAATEPAAFANACAQLYQDPALWEQVRSAALQRCREDYAPTAFAAAVRGILDSVPARPPPR